MDTKRELKANLLLIRDTFTKESTMGKLYLNGEFISYTLENPYINNQRNISAIPQGIYKVRLRTAKESATRDYLHLLVEDVPDRSYILFHRGNTAKDTRGCILTGINKTDNMVMESRKAHSYLMGILINNELAENIQLIIKNR